MNNLYSKNIIEIFKSFSVKPSSLFLDFFTYIKNPDRKFWQLWKKKYIKKPVENKNIEIDIKRGNQ